MKKLVLTAITALILTPGAAEALILGPDDGTIVTVTSGDNLVIWDIGSNSATATLDSDFDWEQGGSGEYRSIAAYDGPGTTDAGTIVTIADSNLILLDLSTGTQIVLDDDTDWKPSEGFRGIAAYTGDGTADNGTIIATTNGGDLKLFDLASDTSITLDDDRNWSGSSEHNGIASYTGDFTADNGTILFNTDSGLFLRDLATDTSTLLDDDGLSWGSAKRRGIATLDVPEASIGVMGLAGLLALSVWRRRVR